MTLLCTEIFINKTSNCTFVSQKNEVIRLKRLNTLELRKAKDKLPEDGKQEYLLRERQMHRREGIGLKNSEACWVQMITLGGQKCMVSLWTDKIIQNASNKLRWDICFDLCPPRCRHDNSFRSYSCGWKGSLVPTFRYTRSPDISVECCQVSSMN